GEGSKNKGNKAGSRRGIEQAALARSPAHGCQCIWVFSLAIEAGPSDRHRQQIIRSFVPATGLDQHDSSIGIGGTEWHGANDVGGRQMASFREPAPAPTI